MIDLRQLKAGDIIEFKEPFQSSSSYSRFVIVNYVSFNVFNFGISYNYSYNNKFNEYSDFANYGKIFTRSEVFELSTDLSRIRMYGSSSTKYSKPEEMINYIYHYPDYKNNVIFFNADSGVLLLNKLDINKNTDNSSNLVEGKFTTMSGSIITIDLTNVNNRLGVIHFKDQKEVVNNTTNNELLKRIYKALGR